MGLTVTAGDIDAAMRGLAGILDESMRVRTIPQMGKYRLAKLRKLLEPVFKPIDAQHADLIRTYGTELFFDKEQKLSKGWQVDQHGPNMQLYTDAWTAILATPIELPASITKIPMALLGDDPKGMGLQVAEYYLLDAFLDGPQPDAPPTA